MALMGLFGLATSGAFVVDVDFDEFRVPTALVTEPNSAEAMILTVFEFLRNIDSIRFVGSVPSAGDMASALGDSSNEGGAIAIAGLLIMGMMFVYPPIAVLLYLLFMTFASERDENAYGLPSSFDHGPKPKNKGEHNAFASYAILTRTDHKPTEEEIAARKEQVHSLYEQRVLGRQQS